MHDNIKKRINIAAKRQPADLVIKNCKIVNVFTHEIIEGDIAISDGKIAAVGNYSGEKEVDAEGMIRLDDWELRPEVQDEIAKVWDQVTTENIGKLGDIDGYWEDFYQMFGFHFDNVDYGADVEVG